jgi:hypothetical protein
MGKIGLVKKKIQYLHKQVGNIKYTKFADFYLVKYSLVLLL